MNNKLKIGIAVILSSVITFVTTNALNNHGQILDNSKLKEAMLIFGQVYNGDMPEKSELTDGAISGILATTQDPYTTYYNTTDFKTYIEDAQGSFVGVGVVVSIDTNGDIIVVSPYEGTPAQRAGILTGDKIIRVDGEDIKGNLDRTVYLMRGQHLKNPEGKEVVVTIHREGVEDFDVTLIREVINTKSVASEMFSEGIGYLQIINFDNDTDTEFAKNIKALQKKGMTKLIIDLRNNPGGVFTAVCNIADQLLGEGVITYTENKAGDRVYKNSDANMIDCPIVVLINKGSASASEVLTGALKDNGRATVVGETSYGKGIVQSVFKLKDGSGMSVTSEKYFTPSGVCIHGIGIVPDIAVEMDTAGMTEVGYYDDLQLQKAVEVLNAK